jgi:hypothetical protein
MTALWAVIYSSDWFMDWWGASIYHRSVKKICLFENGYNIKSITENEINHPGILFLRYFSELLVSSLFVWIILYTCRILSGWKFYEFFCGAFIVLEICIHFRHIRNVSVFSLIKRVNGIRGNISVPKWITLRFAFIEFLTFALMLLVIYVFDNDNFFVCGGMCACIIYALWHTARANTEYAAFKKNKTAPEIT